MLRLLLLLLAVACSPVRSGAAPDVDAYDPLAGGGEVEVIDLEFRYGDAGRIVPLRCYLPAGAKGAVPVVLFSHGLGGSRENNRYCAEHWAARGLAVVAMQHAGSDERVWKEAPVARRMGALRRAANLRSFQARAADVPATLDQLARWNAEGGRLAGRLDLDWVGMSGHSYGAITTQAVGGQSYGVLGRKFTDKRIDAALAMSPSPAPVGDPEKDFAAVSIPWMLMTGTRDSSPIGKATPEGRREVFAGLPGGKGQHYELVLHGAEHMAFSDRTLLGLKHRNPKHHVAIKAMGAAFWDAYLRGDPAAKAWLAGDGPRSLLVERDLWLRK